MAENVVTPDTEPERSPTCVAAIVDAFLRRCGQSKSSNTLRQYTNQLKPYREKFGVREFSAVTSIDIDDFLAEQAVFPDGRQKAPDTRRITIITVQQLHAYAIEKKVIQEPILGKLKKPAGKKRDRLLTDDEIATILKFSSPAFALLFRGYLTSAARPYELADATIADWKRERGLIILTKSKTSEETGKDLKIAVGKEMLPIVLEAIGDRTEGPIFLSPRGGKWTSANITQTFTRIRKRGNLPSDLVNYLSRHKAASMMCKKIGINATKDALNHASIVTTQRYVHTEDSELVSNQDAVGDWIPKPKANEPQPPPAAEPGGIS